MAILEREQQQTQSPQDMMNDIVMRKLQNEKNLAYDLVSKYNTNPKSIKDKDIPRVLQYAEQFGWDTSYGRNKDTAGWFEALGAVVGGGVDAILLDLIKDDWYSNRRTQSFKTAGKIAGLAASLFTPASWMAGAGKATSLASKALRGAAKYLTAPGLVAGGKRALGVALAAKTLPTAARSGPLLAKMASQNVLRTPFTAGNLSAKGGAHLGTLLARSLPAGKFSGLFGTAQKALPYMLPGIGAMRLMSMLGNTQQPNPYDYGQMPEMPMMPQQMP